MMTAAWSAPEPLLKHHEMAAAVPAAEAKALACYDVWLAQEAAMLLRFVEGRPRSSGTRGYLKWVSADSAQTGKRAWLLGDNTLWHISARVTAWVRGHDRQVNQGVKLGVRLMVCRLPESCPRVNPIEPQLHYDKRSVSEPAAVVDNIKFLAHVYEHFACPALPLLQP